MLIELIIKYAIFFDQKLDISNVSRLYNYVIKTLFDLQPQMFFTTDLCERLGLTKNPNDCRKATKINDTYYIESNLGSKAKFDRIKAALTYFDVEDELTIKYKFN